MKAESYRELLDAKQRLKTQRGEPVSESDVYQEFGLARRRAAIYLDNSISGDIIPAHAHPFYEVTFCRNADHIVFLLGGQQYDLQTGDILLIPPDVWHCPILPSGMEACYERYTLWLDDTTFRQMRVLYPHLELAFQQCEKRQSYLLRSAPATWVGLQSGFDMLYRESQEKQPGWELCLAAGAYTLMAHISRTYYFQDLKPGDPQQDLTLDTLLQYVESHYRERITLQDLSRHCMIGRSTICALFQEKMNTTFYQFVIQRRLVSAKNDILKGMPLNEAAETNGFADYSSFYRMFKKAFGMSPTQYLSLHKQMETENTGGIF